VNMEISTHQLENPQPHVSVKNSIAIQLLKAVFMLYLTVAVTVTCLHMVAEYYNTKGAIYHELQILHKMTEPSLANALWDVDMEQLHSTLKGIVNLPVIVGIRIEDEQQIVGMAGTVINQDGKIVTVDEKGTEVSSVINYPELFWYQAPIVYKDHREKSNKVGTATLYSSTHVVFDRVQLSFLFLIINAFIKTIALWTFFLWYGRRLLTRPLTILIDVAKKLDLDRLHHLQVNIHTSGRNELKVLEEAFNTMIQKLFTARQQLTELQIGLEKQVIARTEELLERNSRLIQLNEEVAVLNQRLKAENSRMSTELKVTKRLQQMLLPREYELTKIKELDIAGFMKPAEEVGGDYYDVLEYGGCIKVGIGDVTGHGLESGVLMLMIQTAVRTLVINNETDPLKFFNTLNQVVYDNAQRMGAEKSLSLCLLDYRQGELSISGQHEMVVVVRQGILEVIDTIDLGFPIGLERNIIDFIAVYKLRLNPKDVVVLYTDGITEAENSIGQFYGQKRLCDIIQTHWQQSAKELLNIIIADIKQFIDHQKVYDDVTLLVIKQR